MKHDFDGFPFRCVFCGVLRKAAIQTGDYKKPCPMSGTREAADIIQRRFLKRNGRQPLTTTAEG